MDHPVTARRPGVVLGVCPVLETPFTDDGGVDAAGFVRVVDHVLSTGVTSVMYAGFASEFHKLTHGERRTLTGLLLDCTRGRPDVAAVVSVPDHATVVAVEEARWAVEQGADALNVLPPHFLGPSRAAVRDHLAAVLEAAAPCPVVLQYAPAQTGTALDASAIAELAARSPNLVQVKVESSPPGTLISALAAQAPELGAVVGSAGLQLPDALHRGAVGVQPGCSFIELYLRVWEQWHTDRAAALVLHRRMLPYISYWMQGVELVVAAEKLVSARRGLIASAHCRAPGHALDAEETALVDRFLVEFADELPPVKTMTNKSR